LSKIFSKVKNFFIKKVYKIITERTTVRKGTIKDIILRKNVRWIKTGIKNKRGEYLFKKPKSKI